MKILFAFFYHIQKVLVAGVSQSHTHTQLHPSPNSNLNASNTDVEYTKL